MPLSRAVTLRTLPFRVGITVPLTIRVPPRGAWGGMVLAAAPLALSVKAWRVFPLAGLEFVSSGLTSGKRGTHTH